MMKFIKPALAIGFTACFLVFPATLASAGDKLTVSATFVGFPAGSVCGVQNTSKSIATKWNKRKNVFHIKVENEGTKADFFANYHREKF
jgi:hypothetical protein